LRKKGKMLGDWKHAAWPYHYDFGMLINNVKHTLSMTNPTYLPQNLKMQNSDYITASLATC
jgi:hypothetical protein